MSTPFMRRVADAPGWAVCLATGMALTTTTIVVEHKHAVAKEHPAAAPAPPPAAAPPPPAAAAAAPRQQAVPVSRSAVGGLGRRALARAGALLGKRPKRAARVRPHGRRPHARKPHVRTAQPPRRPPIAIARSTAAQTVARAMRSTLNVPGMCLAWSRQQAGIPSRYSDAATAWRHAIGRRPRDPNPPRGAAVYWTGGSHGFGHIAISVGHGRVRSSDAGGQGDVATVPIHHLSVEWDLRYAGWANSINGYTIRGVRGAGRPPA
jgi:hypothetical protein